MERALKTLWYIWLLCIVWKLLELLIYHEIQPRVVDDIMVGLMAPFIWKSTGGEHGKT